MHLGLVNESWLQELTLHKTNVMILENTETTTAPPMTRKTRWLNIFDAMATTT